MSSSRRTPPRASRRSSRPARRKRRLVGERLEDRRLLAVGGIVPDTVRPWIASIVNLGASSTNATAIEWRVRFTEPVVGVDAADFALRAYGTLASSQPLVVTGSGQDYTVAARGLSGEGTAFLDFYDTATVIDLAGNPLATFRTPEFLAEQTVLQPGDIAANQFFQRSVAADVNRDGRMDLVVGVGSSSGADVTRVAAVKILPGNGNGQFQPPLTYQVGFGTLDGLKVVDVTNDGIPDIIASWWSPSIWGASFLKGNGNGTFEPRQSIASVPVFGGIDIADFNADGKPDLAVADPSNGRVAVLDGNGAGGFAAPRYLASQKAPYDLEVADFNGDGKPDIAVAHPYRDPQNAGGVGIFLGKGDGTFESMQFFSTDAQSEQDSLAVGDFDGDGRTDFAHRYFNSQSSNTATIGLNRTSNGSSFVSFNRSRLSQIPGRLDAVADLDGDGWQDLVGADVSSTSGGLMFGRGTGTFGSRLNASGWTVADFNGDRRPDIATSTGVRLAASFDDLSVISSDQISRSAAVPFAPTGLTVVPRDRAAVLAWTAPQPAAGTIVERYDILATRDDGVRWSVVASAPATATGAVVTGLANGTAYRFRVRAVVDEFGGEATAASASVVPTVGRLPIVESLSRVGSSPAPGPQVRWIARFSEPVSGVDATDFVLVSPGGAVSTDQPLRVERTGEREYTITSSGLRGLGPVGVNLVDDGTIRDADGFRLTRPGATDFGPRQTYEAGSLPAGLAVRDFDGDSNPDIVASQYVGGTSILYGRGDGTFMDAAPVSANGRLLWSGDLDRDGRGDVVLGESDRLDTLKLASDRSFQPSLSTPVQYPSSASTADLGNDEFPQLFLAHSDLFGAGQCVSWLMGSSAGFSSPRISYLRGDMLYAGIVSTDVNRDGTPDVVYASTYGVGVLLARVVAANSLGDGLLAPPRFYGSTVATERGLAAADVNDDGFVDIVSMGVDSVSVLLGQSDGVFAPRLDIATGSGNQGLTVFDLDGDGKRDLLIAGVGGVTFLQGDGTGQFALRRVIAAGDGPTAVAASVQVADVDRDGRMDLVASEWLTASLQPPTKVAVLRGSASGSFTGESFEINAPPTVAKAAAAAPATVTGTTTALSVLGADDGGEAKLTYTWASSGPAAVAFSANGTNAAKLATATFARAGAYTFTVTIADAGGLKATSSVVVTVTPTLASIGVGPAAATLGTNATRQFTATGRDQFGVVLASQPGFTWSVTGIGTVSAAGLYTAPAAAGSAAVRAASGAVVGTAVVSVVLAPPAAPRSLAATTISSSQIRLTWIDASNNETGFVVDRATDAGFTKNLVTTPLPAGTTALSVTGLAATTTYSFRVRATNAAGASANSTPASATTAMNWGVFTSAADIGGSSPTGSTSFASPTYTVRAGGAGLTGKSDGFHFASSALTGNGSIVVRVSSLQNTGSGARAGIMFRDTTAANARYAGLFVTPGGGVVFQRRTVTGGATASTTVAGVAAPVWLRLTRTGNVFRAFYSSSPSLTQPTSWTPVGRATTVTLATTARVGLAATSGVVGTANTSTMNGVAFTGSVLTATP